MRLPLSFAFLPIVLAAQVHFQAPVSSPVTTMNAPSTFAFKEGPDVFSPKDLVGLGRPGTGVANLAGDLLLVPYNQYSSKDKKCVLFCSCTSMELTIVTELTVLSSSRRWRVQSGSLSRFL